MSKYNTECTTYFNLASCQKIDSKKEWHKRVIMKYHTTLYYRNISSPLQNSPSLLMTLGYNMRVSTMNII